MKTAVDIEVLPDGRIGLKVVGEKPVFVGPTFAPKPMKKGSGMRLFPGEERVIENGPIRVVDEASVLEAGENDTSPEKSHGDDA